MSDRRGAGSRQSVKRSLLFIGKAMEMYSCDWSGHYPTSLTLLTPNYLKTIPTCPAARPQTYKVYTGPDAPQNEEGFIDFYYLECEGDWHRRAGVAKNHPARYSVGCTLER